ncbi:hypothetical protein AL542_04860 [Grimontia hollisae]|uniref:Glycosyl transferase group 1 n=1 Tax=Grimontia hollisae CIP 101886 TaxID=675812 RepID=D0IC00_GRIHO|nr:glycosyltransferase [Grimontia hollisae]AMG29788.2 hypothetical protein AL542_04860 [Grimontia hollisae]EEY71418.1 glycosyl transferase group 1 [Grimontia hollisae CIP 101886]STO43356.1 Glycogen synthase [Grimontia hollisae]
MLSIRYKDKVVFAWQKKTNKKSISRTINGFSSNTLKRAIFKIVCYFCSMLSIGRHLDDKTELAVSIIKDRLEKYFNIELFSVLWSNSESSRERYYIKFYDHKGNCLSFTKLSFENYRDRIRNEAHWLYFFSGQKSINFEVPDVHLLLENELFISLSVQPISSDYFKCDIFTYPNMEKVLEDIKFESSSIISKEDFFKTINENLSEINIEFTENVITSRNHNDIGSENFFVSKVGKPILIDWEFCSDFSPFYVDQVSSWLGYNCNRIKNNTISLECLKIHFQNKEISYQQVMYSLIYLSYVKKDSLAQRLLRRKKFIRVSSSYFPALEMGGAVTADFGIDKLISKFTELEVMTTNAGLENKISQTCTHLLENIPVTYYEYSIGRNYSLSFKLLLDLFFKLKGTDHVLISGIWNIPVLLAPMMCRARGVEYTIFPHGSLHPEKFILKHEIVKHLILKLIVKKSIIKAKYIQVATKDEMEGIRFLLPNICNRFKLLPFPVEDCPIYYEKKSPFVRPKGFLFVGRLNYIKAVDSLVQAFEKINFLYPELVLELIGPEEGISFKDLISKVGDSTRNKISWHGCLAREELEAFYKDDYILVVPSHSENFGMVIIEAARFSMPSIVSRHVGLSTLLSEYSAAFITDNDVDSLFNTMKMALDDTKTTETVSKNAKYLFENNFSESVIDIRLRELFL